MLRDSSLRVRGGLGIILYLSLGSGSKCQESTANNATQCILSTGPHLSGRNETRLLRLIDGSTIRLGEMSQVTLDLSTAHRHVQMDRGAAQFRVAKEGATVFEVSVDTARIQAVGTAFTVRKTGSDSARVEVTEDAVDLIIRNERPIRVKAGQNADFDPKLIRLSGSTPSRAPSATASTPGSRLIFRGTSLNDAAREFNRYNTKLRIIVDEDVADRTVRGEFSSANPQGFAAAVAVIWGLTSSVSHDSVTRTETIHISKPGAQPSNSPRSTRGHTSVEKQQ